MRHFTGDGVNWFSSVLDTRTLPQALHYRYLAWTSRLLIEAPLFLLSHHMHIFLWAMLDIFMCAVVWWALNQLTDREHPWLVTALVLIYPMADLKSAGWMATTINYMWPLAMLLVAVLPLYMMYKHQPVKPVWAALSLMAELFATNFETVAAMYLIILAFFSITMICVRRLSWRGALYILLQWVIAIANIIFILTCPGNRVRNNSEVLTWMKDFASMTSIDKLVLGVNSTVLQLISTSLLFAIFSIVLIGYTWMQGGRRQPFMLGLASLPGTSILLVHLAPTFFPTILPLIKNFSTASGVNSINYYSPSSYIMFIWSMCIIGSSIIVVFTQSKALADGVSLASVLGAGLASRVLMGFSPTIFASGPRTFIFLDFAIIYVLLKMIQIIDADYPHSRFRVYGQFSLAIVTIIAVLGNIIAIGIV